MTKAKRPPRPAEGFKIFVLEQLSAAGFEDVYAKAMFGGFGLYSETYFFGLISKAGRLYFKTDDASRQAFLDAGMSVFEPRPGKPLKAYYEVPVNVLEDLERLADWTQQAIAIAIAS